MKSKLMAALGRKLGNKKICKLKFFPGKSFFLIETNPQKPFDVADIDINRFEGLRKEKEYFRVTLAKGIELVLIPKLMLNNQQQQAAM